jgi:hypothetical protein
MIPDNTPLLTALFNNFGGIFKFGFIVFAVLYFIFSLIVLRQINLMTRTIVTEGGPILRILGIAYAVLSLGVLIYFIAFFSL